jgi:hypothetical protein
MRRGKEGQCFGNAGHIIRRDGWKKTYLRYCEGWLYGPYDDWPVHHAWIEDSRNGKVHEVTVPAVRCDSSDRYHAIIKLSAEDYSEAGWPAGYESIMLPCKHIGCMGHPSHDDWKIIHFGGIDDNEVCRINPEEFQEEA